MPANNFPPITHEPSGFRRRAEFANMIGVSNPKPLGQQKIEGQP
jgi:hypothetical protein